MDDGHLVSAVPIQGAGNVGPLRAMRPVGGQGLPERRRGSRHGLLRRRWRRGRKRGDFRLVRLLKVLEWLAKSLSPVYSQLTSLKLLVPVREDFIVAVSKHGQTPLDHDGVVYESHLYGCISWLEPGLSSMTTFLTAGLGFWKKVAIADHAILRRWVDGY